MRPALIGVAAVLAAAAALIAIAQPTTPPSATAPAQTTERKLMPINWGEVREALKAQRLPRAQIRQMTLAPNAPQPSLPMLLPVQPSLAAAAVNLFPQADSYSASMRMGDITVEVHGDRRATVLKEGDPMMRLINAKQKQLLAGAGVPFTVDKTEGGFDLTFSRFGAAYLISIECRNAETDERCTKPDFIRALAESMGLFGKDAP
jgi:hypothetical protein